MGNLADNIQALVAVISIVATGLVGAGTLLWKMSTWAAQARTKDEQHDKIAKEIAQRLAALAKTQAELHHAIIELRGEMRAREKGHDKIEGRMEQQSEMIMRLTASLQEATGSLNAMWKTLQTLFPERVPKRASDRIPP